MKICLDCRKKMGDALKQCPYCRGEAVPEGDDRLEVSQDAETSVEPTPNDGQVAEVAAPLETQEQDLFIPEAIQPETSKSESVNRDLQRAAAPLEGEMTSAQKEAALEAILLAAKKEEKKPMAKGKAAALYLGYMILMGLFAHYFYSWMYGGQ